MKHDLYSYPLDEVVQGKSILEEMQDKMERLLKEFEEVNPGVEPIVETWFSDDEFGYKINIRVRG